MTVMQRALVAVLSLFLIANPAWAARTRAHDAAESSQYGRKFGGMIGRGVINVTTCFMDLLVNIVHETRTGPPLVGTLVGIGKGAGCTTLRVLSGAVDLTTFWVPGFNGFPVSDSYDNCVPDSGVSSSSDSDSLGYLEPSGLSPEPGMPSSSGAAVPGAPLEEKPQYTK